VVLRTRDLTRAFGGVKAVDRVALELRRGEVYGFLGRNGSGKTTTLRMLVGTLRPDAGVIELLGHSRAHIDAEQRRELGYVSQEQTFYPWMTARELGRFVSGFYASWDDAEFARLLALLDVPDRKKAAQLSGGTRTKLGLALALAHRPALLLLDEPTAGLDPVARREFLDILGEQVRREGQTVLFSSHLVDEVEQVSHRIGILQDGALRYQGPLEELRRAARRVELPERLLQVPAGLELIRTEPGEAGAVAHVLVGAAPAWEQSGLSGENITQLSLEDIFLAFARRAPRE